MSQQALMLIEIENDDLLALCRAVEVCLGIVVRVQVTPKLTHRYVSEVLTSTSRRPIR